MLVVGLVYWLWRCGCFCLLGCYSGGWCWLLVLVCWCICLVSWFRLVVIVFLGVCLVCWVGLGIVLYWWLYCIICLDRYLVVIVGWICGLVCCLLCWVLCVVVFIVVVVGIVMVVLVCSIRWCWLLVVRLW